MKSARVSSVANPGTLHLFAKMGNLTHEFILI
jgi:hypothetical protein